MGRKKIKYGTKIAGRNVGKQKIGGFFEEYVFPSKETTQVDSLFASPFSLSTFSDAANIRLSVGHADE